MAVRQVKEIQEEPTELGPEFAVQKAEESVITELEKRSKRSKVSTVALMGTFLLAAIAFLYFARVFFLPIVLAIVLSFLFKPVVKWLARFKVSPTAGAALVLILVLVVLGNGITQLSKPAADFVSTLPESLRQVETKLRQFLRHAEQLSKAAAQVEDMATTNPEQQPAPKVQVRRSSLADTFFSVTTSFVAGAIETIVLLYFLMAYGELFLQKIVKVLPDFHEKKKAAAIAHEVQQNISTFLFTVTLINATLGVLVGLGVWLAGLGNPILWGATAALLNFIPYFGPVIGVTVLALAGLLSFDSVGRGLIPPLIYLGLHALESNFITPLILGRRLTLNPLIIFISLMFWTWMWGIPGALLSVPLLMILKIVCDHFKALAPMGEFLNG